MKLPYKRFDLQLPQPKPQTAGSAAFDLYSREAITIPAHSLGYIPLNFAVEIPKGYWILMAARSSLHKMGIMMVNGIGIFDHDFCGDNDEYALAAYNFTESIVHIDKGIRLTQALLVKGVSTELIEVASLSNPNRGGFGSTGKK